MTPSELLLLAQSKDHYPILKLILSRYNSTGNKADLQNNCYNHVKNTLDWETMWAGGNPESQHNIRVISIAQYNLMDKFINGEFNYLLKRERNLPIQHSNAKVYYL